MKIRALALTLLLAAPALLVAAPATAADEIRIEKQDPLLPPLVQVKRITIIGTPYEDAVRLVMMIRPGDEVTPEAIREDGKRIAQLGYFADVTPQLIKQADGYELVIYLRENPIVKQVVLENSPTLFSREQLLSPFQDFTDQTLNYADLQQAQAEAEAMYHRQGYTLARMEVVSETNGHVLDKQGQLRLRIHEGVIESIEPTGQERTEAQVILREFALQPGMVFEQQRFSADLTRLQNLGIFNDIKLRPEPGKLNPHHYRLVLELQENKTADVGLNFSLNNRDGLLGGFHLTDTNFLGKGQYLNLNFQAGLDFLNLLSGQAQQSQRAFYGRLDFGEPWLFADRTALGASVFSERTALFYGLDVSSLLPDSNGLQQTRSGVSLSLGRPLFGDQFSPWRGRLAFTAEQVQLQDFRGVAQREVSLSKRLSATDVLFNLSGQLSYDTRNNVFNPTQGFYGQLSAQPVWGDAAYLKLAGQLNTYIPVLDPGLTLALGLQGGSFVGQHPLYEQFFGTGPSSLRGWPENGTLFGSQYLIGSAEARFPIYDFISGVLFTDIGNFFPDRQSENNQGLPFKYGVGAGVRLQTPLGMLRLDYGIRDFQVLGAGGFWDASQFHFSIGQKF